MQIRPLDTLLALKAITLVPGLKDSDRRVASVLIEHFNRKSGRCDPSVQRISEMTGFSTRTVIRSTRALVGAGLFRIDRHGGYSNRNSYAPHWGRFEEIRRNWNEKLFAKSRASGRPALSPASRQHCHLERDGAVTQTCRTNLQNETYVTTATEEGSRAIAQYAHPRLPQLSTPSHEAASTAAERRWFNALHRQFSVNPAAYGEVIALIDDEMRLAATEAELRLRGAGLPYILYRLRRPNVEKP